MSALGTSVTVVGSLLGVGLLIYVLYRIAVCCVTGSASCWREFLAVFCCRPQEDPEEEEQVRYRSGGVSDIEMKLDRILQRLNEQRESTDPYQYDDVPIPDVSRLAPGRSRGKTRVVSR